VTRFLDVPGASGARYRFRRTDAGDDLPVNAGNFVAVTEESSPRYLACGTARSLARAAPAIREGLGESRGAVLFIRLNVSRVVRDAEHEDIVAAVAPARRFEDLG
jgi:hypothetical protein